MTDERRRLVEAMEAAEPATAVRELARRFRAEGMGQVAMFRLFREQQERLSGEDLRYDALVDTMDLIWGGPWAKGGALFDEELTEDRLELEQEPSMTLRPFPAESHVRWRRIDVPGREEARIESTVGGWRLTGELDVEEEGLAARLRYVIECDPQWRTRSAVVEGEAGGDPVRFELTADGAGNWVRDDAPMPDLAGALDVDLGFTPATNTLPIRRLALAIGESAPVRSAWLRFPELRLEPLEQTYTREAELGFRYHALVDGESFIARLDTDAFGRVLHYEGLWEAELTVPDGGSTEKAAT